MKVEIGKLYVVEGNGIGLCIEVEDAESKDFFLIHDGTNYKVRRNLAVVRKVCTGDLMAFYRDHVEITGGFLLEAMAEALKEQREKTLIITKDSNFVKMEGIPWKAEKVGIVTACGKLNVSYRDNGSSLVINADSATFEQLETIALNECRSLDPRDFDDEVEEEEEEEVEDEEVEDDYDYDDEEDEEDED